MVIRTYHYINNNKLSRLTNNKNPYIIRRSIILLKPYLNNFSRITKMKRRKPKDEFTYLRLI